VRVPSDGRDGERLLALLRAVEAGRLPGVDPSRVGLFGVSVGGPIALEAAARFLAGGGRGLRALCLVGAPDDARRLVRGWFLAGIGGAGEREKAKEFGRAMVRRAGLDATVPAEDRDAVRAWLESSWTPWGDPDGLRTEAAREFVARARSPVAEEAEIERAVEAAWPTLKALSPAHAEVDLAVLRRVPVFLIHGADDALVPASEMPLLAERLGGAPSVRTFRSASLGHVEVGSQEAWEHVLFVDEFFDAVTD
jgi:pimeloyl-ACP methyl ester carboxylesterase